MNNNPNYAKLHGYLIAWLSTTMVLMSMISAPVYAGGNSFGDGGGDASADAIIADIVKRGADTIQEVKYIFDLLPPEFQEKRGVFERIFAKTPGKIYRLEQDKVYEEDIAHLCHDGPIQEPRRGWKRIDALSCGEKIVTYVSRDSWADLSHFLGASVDDLIPNFPQQIELLNSRFPSDYGRKVSLCRQTRLLVHELNVLAGMEMSGNFEKTDGAVLPLMGNCRVRSISRFVKSLLYMFYNLKEEKMKQQSSRSALDPRYSWDYYPSWDVSFFENWVQTQDRDFTPLYRMLCSSDFLRKEAETYVYRRTYNGKQEQYPTNLKAFIDHHILCLSKTPRDSLMMSVPLDSEKEVKLASFFSVNGVPLAAIESRPMSDGSSPRTWRYAANFDYHDHDSQSLMFFMTTILKSAKVNSDSAGLRWQGGEAINPTATAGDLKIWEYLIVFPE